MTRTSHPWRLKGGGTRRRCISSCPPRHRLADLLSPGEPPHSQCACGSVAQGCCECKAAENAFPLPSKRRDFCHPMMSKIGKRNYIIWRSSRDGRNKKLVQLQRMRHKNIEFERVPHLEVEITPKLNSPKTRQIQQYREKLLIRDKSDDAPTRMARWHVGSTTRDSFLYTLGLQSRRV